MKTASTEKRMQEEICGIYGYKTLGPLILIGIDGTFVSCVYEQNLTIL